MGGGEDTKIEKLKDLLRQMMKSPKNMRSFPKFSLIMHTDASKGAVAASFIQEVAAEVGYKEKVLIHAASKSFESVETRNFTIRREIFVVVFAEQNFRKFLLGRHFVISTDHHPLVNLFKKPLLLIENEHLRGMVAQISEYCFSVEYVSGASNEFSDWL